MPIPVAVTKFVLSGSLAGGEIWQSGFWQAGAVDNPADATTAAQGVWTAFSSTTTGNFGAVMKSTFWSSSTTFDRVTAYSYVHGGPTASVVGTYGGTAIVGTAANFHPDQIAVCVTTLSAHAGASYRGRMFLPANGATLAAGALFQTADITALVGAIKTAINNCGGAVIVSQHLDVATPVTQLRCDQRPDVQRRRANRQSRGSATTVTL